MLLGVSLGLLDERDWGTFDRIRALPVAAGNVLLGKLLSRFVVGVVQMILLFAVGYALFDISLGPEPWALLLPIAGIAFAGTAFGLIVAVFARTRDAVLPLGSIAIVTMAAVGGCWWPIDLEPQWMRNVALAFPTTWAMEAFNDLMIRRRSRRRRARTDGRARRLRARVPRGGSRAVPPADRRRAELRALARFVGESCVPIARP